MFQVYNASIKYVHEWAVGTGYLESTVKVITVTWLEKGERKDWELNMIFNLVVNINF